MRSHLFYDFLIDKENCSIVIRREFAAAFPVIWDAYTNPRILDQWWAPKPWKAKTKSMDFREGGYWLYSMVGPKGDEHWSRADYLHIDFQKSFTGKDSFTDANGHINHAMPQSTWEVNFTDKDQNTLVEFLISFDELAQLEATIQMGFKEGMTSAMEGLDELLLKMN